MPVRDYHGVSFNRLMNRRNPVVLLNVLSGMRVHVSRVRMPLLAYFAVLSPCMLSLLFVAEAVLDPLPPRKDPTPVVLPGRGVQKTLSLPILTVQEAPAPPAWAVTSVEDQTRPIQVNAPEPRIKTTKTATGHKTPKRVAQSRRNGERNNRYAATTSPTAYESIGRVW